MVQMSAVIIFHKNVLANNIVPLPVRTMTIEATVKMNGINIVHVWW